MPNGMYGGVRGWELITPPYSIAFCICFSISVKVFVYSLTNVDGVDFELEWSLVFLSIVFAFSPWVGNTKAIIYISNLQCNGCERLRVEFCLCQAGPQ